MIVKLDEPMAWRGFVLAHEPERCHLCGARTEPPIRAVRMEENFLAETASGWLQGEKGQWLVEFGPHGQRTVVDSENFREHYRPWERRLERRRPR